MINWGLFWPQSFYFWCNFVNFWNFIVKFSVTVHFLLPSFQYDCMLKCHDMTSWHEVKVWRHCMKWHHHHTSETPSSISWISFFSQKNWLQLITKTPQNYKINPNKPHKITKTKTPRLQKPQKDFKPSSDVMTILWRHVMTSDVLNTDHFTTLLSPEENVMNEAKIFFSFLRFFWSMKSMACRPDTWPWRVTVYVKVTWSYKWPSYLISGPKLYMLETWIVFPWFVGSRKSMECKPDTWRCTSRSRDLTSDLFYLGPCTC